jgi:hypothetical protein
VGGESHATVLIGKPVGGETGLLGGARRRTRRARMAMAGDAIAEIPLEAGTAELVAP